MPLKILGTGDAPRGVTVHAHAFTRTAREKLEAAGSTIQRLSWPDNAPIDDETDAAEAAATHARTKAGRAEARALASGETPAAASAPAPSEPASEEPADADDDAESES